MLRSCETESTNTVKDEMQKTKRTTASSTTNTNKRHKTTDLNAMFRRCHSECHIFSKFSTFSHTQNMQKICKFGVLLENRRVGLAVSDVAQSASDVRPHMPTQSGDMSDAQHATSAVRHWIFHFHDFVFFAVFLLSEKCKKWILHFHVFVFFAGFLPSEKYKIV